MQSARQYLANLMFLDVRQLMYCGSFVRLRREMQGRVPVVINCMNISFTRIDERDTNVRVAPLRGQVERSST